MAQAVAWIGQDGNLYYGSGVEGTGVQNMGKWAGNYEQSSGGIRSTNFDTPLGQGAGFMPNVKMMDDPNPSGNVPSSSTAPSGGSGRVYDPLNQGAVDATNASLASLDTILANALANAQRGYKNAVGTMNQQEQSQRKSYDEGTLSNMQNYDANLGASLRAGRSGLSGLMAALRGGGGAGNDFARDWVQNTVADTAANDIREGYNTFDENKRGLDTTLSTFLTELGRKRQENEDTLVNNRRAANLYDAQQKQSLNQTLSELYGKAGMFDQASDFMGRAGSQAGRIAENSGARVSAYNTKPVEVESPDITAFAAPEERSMTASPDRTSSGIFSILDPRRREREAVGA